MNFVLFDHESTFSYKLPSLDNGLEIHYDLLDMLIGVSTPMGEFVLVEKVYRSCIIIFVRRGVKLKWIGLFWRW